MSDDPESQVDQVKLKSVRKRLKPVRKHQKPGPTISEFKDWVVTRKTNYGYTGCFQAVARAESNLNSAQEQLKEAKLAAKQLVPSNRSYGESEVQFKQRKEAGEKVYESVLQPYRKEVSKCAKELREANRIKDISVELLNTPLLANPNYEEEKE